MSPFKYLQFATRIVSSNPMLAALNLNFEQTEVCQILALDIFLIYLLKHQNSA